MGSRLPQLRAAVREKAENRPGVYRMLGPSGEVLYVGKSVHVRTRLLSYFRAREGEKAAEIIGHAHAVQWDYTPSEFAALLEEFRLIKRWRPLYNVEHKRDRTHSFLKLTREAVPRLLCVRQVVADGAEYFGPLRGRAALAEGARALSDLLELRDCAADTPMRLADQLQLFRHKEEARCMRGQLSRCLAPCAGGCTRPEYLERVEVARRFLNGETDAPLPLLRERMAVAARRLQFEYAAELRDRVERLEQMREDLLELDRTVAGLTFLYTVPGFAGEDRVYVVRRGSVRLEAPAPRTPAEQQALEEAARDLFARPEVETLGQRAHEAQEVSLLARWFRLHPEELTRTLRTSVPEAGTLRPALRGGEAVG